jgi:hypothetical protein
MNSKKLLRIAALVAGFIPGLATADSAIAESASGTTYACWDHTSVEDAKRCALDMCAVQSGHGCTLLDTSPRDSGGYAAVAQSPTRVTWAIGFVSQDHANQTALKRCAEQASTGETCQVVMTYLDRYRFNPLIGKESPYYVHLR